MEMLSYEIVVNLTKDIFVFAAMPAILVYVFGKYKEFKNKNEERISVLSALHAELSSLDMLICSREEQYLEFASEGNKHIFFPYISITLNYFSVFDNISSKFGLINNQDAIELIIKCYIEVKGLFDDVKDLEYYAKRILTFPFEVDATQRYREVLINNYTQNLKNIVDFQLPMVKGLIKQSLQCIEEEKNKIKSKNTLRGFLFG